METIYLELQQKSSAFVGKDSVEAFFQGNWEYIANALD